MGLRSTYWDESALFRFIDSKQVTRDFQGSLWDRIWADDRVVFLPEPEDLEKEFRKRSRLSSRSPKVWADAYILAFASVADLKLVTFDQALKSHGDNVLVL
jgi:uncharacterized protein